MLLNDEEKRNYFRNHMNYRDDELYNPTASLIVCRIELRIVYEVKQFQRVKKSLKYISKRDREIICSEILNGLELVRAYLMAFQRECSCINHYLNQVDSAITSAREIDLDSDDVDE